VRRGNSYIGAPIERVEDLRFLRGRGEYIDDVRRDGLWHAVIFRSSIAHAKIKSIDASAALAMAGVRAVFTGKDIGPVLPVSPLRVPRPEQHPGAPYLQPVIAGDVLEEPAPRMGQGQPIEFPPADRTARNGTDLPVSRLCRVLEQSKN
jgi:carbon-monoxide dehydrogenase large subunit